MFIKKGPIYLALFYFYTVQLTQIIIYPLKGLPGIELPKAQISHRGLQFDRRYMLVDESGTFISQRTFPMLSLLKIDLLATGFKVHSANNLNGIILPFEIEGEPCQVKVWEDVCLAYQAPQKLSKWFSNELQTNCRLVYMPERSLRLLETTIETGKKLVSFADAFPFLLIGQSSLDALNARLSEPIKMDRFRPNLVFTSAPAHAEDGFDEFNIGLLEFVAAKPCARCAVPSVNQQTGKKEKEPLHTLSQYRQFENKIYFGENVYCKTDVGTLKVGDNITLKSTKKSLSF
ncbi:MAG: MOSC domain-containing protein [bacterium]|nr:MOSC domain-containing protein [bacterium]